MLVREDRFDMPEFDMPERSCKWIHTDAGMTFKVILVLLVTLFLGYILVGQHEVHVTKRAIENGCYAVENPNALAEEVVVLECPDGSYRWVSVEAYRKGKD